MASGSKYSKDYLVEVLKRKIKERDNREVARNRVFLALKPYYAKRAESSSYHDRSTYSLNEILQYFDKPLVIFLYRAILKRAPDKGGLDSRLKALRERQYSRVSLILRMRYSQEGKKEGVRIKGLLRVVFFERLYAVPFFGRVLLLIRTILGLSSLHSQLENIQGDLSAAISNRDEELEKMADHYNRQLELISKASVDASFSQHEKRNSL